MIKNKFISITVAALFILIGVYVFLLGFGEHEIEEKNEASREFTSTKNSTKENNSENNIKGASSSEAIAAPPTLPTSKIQPGSALPIPVIMPQMPEIAPDMPIAPPQMPEIAPAMPELVRPMDGAMPYDAGLKELKSK